MANAYPRLPNLSEQEIEHFWKRVDKTPGFGPNGDCWEWTGYRWKPGYGCVTLQHATFRTHRVAFFLHYGYDPGHLLVRHFICNHPPCCNPAHLKDGTVKDNSEDARRAGRISCGKKHGDALRPNAARGDRHGSRTHPERVPRGDRNGARKHPERMARGDRSGARLHPERMPRGEANGNTPLTTSQVLQIHRDYANGITQVEIAKRNGVRQTTISNILRGVTWKHIKPE